MRTCKVCAITVEPTRENWVSSRGVFVGRVCRACSNAQATQKWYTQPQAIRDAYTRKRSAEKRVRYATDAEFRKRMQEKSNATMKQKYADNAEHRERVKAKTKEWVSLNRAYANATWVQRKLHKQIATAAWASLLTRSRLFMRLRDS